MRPCWNSISSAVECGPLVRPTGVAVPAGAGVADGWLAAEDANDADAVEALAVGVG